MFNTMTDTIDKLMADEKMADAMGDLTILRDETASIKAQWSARDTELATMAEQHAATIAQLKAEAEGIKTELETKTSAHVEKEILISEVLDRAVLAYKKATLIANPDLPAGILDELGETSTVEQIDAAITKAQGIVDKIKAAIAVPGGAPARGKIDLASMSSMDKIRHAITN